MMAKFYRIISRRLPFIKYNFFISLAAEQNIPLQSFVDLREMEKSSVDVFINCSRFGFLGEMENEENVSRRRDIFAFDTTDELLLTCYY